MIQIITVRNELYSSLSLLAGQPMLMFTELPGRVTVLERFFQLEYSESYTCNMQGDAKIEGYNYCMPVGTALETLLAMNYDSFILTVELLVWVSTTLMVGYIKYLILMLEKCMVTVIVKAHVYCWKYHLCIN